MISGYHPCDGLALIWQKGGQSIISYLQKLHQSLFLPYNYFNQVFAINKNESVEVRLEVNVII